MTVSYLTRAVPASFSLDVNSNLTATAQLTPPMGQYWLPRLVRVGVTLNNRNPPSPSPVITNLYHGGIGDVSADAFVDSTANGLGDVTGVMNGTLIQPGEFLTASWSALDLVNQPSPSFGQAYLQVVGLSADTITEMIPELASSSPGQRFAAQSPDVMNMPQAGSDMASFVFSNPGQNNIVVLLNPNVADNTYIYNLTAWPFQAFTGAEGAFASSNTVNRFATINPFSYVGPSIWNFNGLKMNPNGLVFIQTGNAAANSMSYNAVVTHRFMSF